MTSLQLAKTLFCLRLSLKLVRKPLRKDKLSADFAVALPGNLAHLREARVSKIYLCLQVGNTVFC
jgi:hypothetical protein